MICNYAFCTGNIGDSFQSNSSSMYVQSSNYSQRNHKAGSSNSKVRGG